MTIEVDSAGKSGAGEITRLLERMREGDGEATEELVSRLYHELRAMAGRMMAREAAGRTLQATALVHEAWLRLGCDPGQRFPGRVYFFAAAGEVMRRILVECARRRKSLKRGGDQQRVDLELVEIAGPAPDDELLAVHEVLEGLSHEDAHAAELVKLRYFVGLTEEEAAKELNVSLSSVQRTWRWAKAWLHREIERGRRAPAFDASSRARP